MTDNNALVSGLLGDKFRLDMMVPQISKEAPKTSDGLPVLFSVLIQEKQDNMKNRGNRNSTVELKRTVIHQHQISGHK